MNYYISNPIFDKQIGEIRQKIRLSMNGIVSDQMKNSGICYKKNYGVSFPRIKELAQQYVPNHDLAQRLWALKIRETMIMASLLQPIDKFTAEMANDWAKEFSNIEIIEQTCMHLFSKLAIANTLALNWILADNNMQKTAGYILAARISDKLNETEIIEIIKTTKTTSSVEELHLYKSIALCLSRFSRKNKQIATIIMKEIEPYSHGLTMSEQYIYNEVKQEILFLDIL